MFTYSLAIAAMVLATWHLTTAFGADPPKADEFLRASKSGRFFETASGKPWLWLGDTSWALLASYTPDEEKVYLQARAKLGFTLVQTVCAWDGGTGTEKGTNPNPNTAGVQPWADNDPLKPNEPYWKNVDNVIAIARENGLYIGLLPSWGSHVVNTRMITEANARQYGLWLGKRYKEVPNIIWINGGDRKVADAPKVWKLLGEGLAEGDGGAHPITFHPGMERKATSGSLHDEKWLTVNMIQTWASYTDIHECVATDYKRTPPKPVILGEGAYEEGPEYPTKPITPLVVRKQAWWAFLSGGSFTYGHNDMWRKNPTWEKSLASEGAKNMRVLRDVLWSVKWWELVPDQSLFATGEGKDKTLNVAARSSGGEWAIVYLSSETKVELKLDGIGARKLHGTWIDPKTGEKTTVGEFDGSKTQEFSTPKGWEDAVLLLTAK